MTQTPPPARPISVWVIYLVLFLQGSAVMIVTIGSIITSQAEVLDTAGQIALVALYMLTGVVLIILAFRILMGASGARTPVMVLQLLVVILSFSFFAGGLVSVGIFFLVPAAATLILLFVRPTQIWLEQRSATPDP